MKKVTFAIVIALVSLTVAAQTKYATISLSFHESTMDISVSESDDGTTIWIDAESLDGIASYPVIAINESNYPKFKSNLDIVRTKYQEWIKVAKDNNVTEMHKEIPTQPQSVMGAFQMGNNLYVDFSINLSYEFKITSSGQYIVIFRTNEMVDWDNEFITCDDAVLVFSSVKEIDAYIAATSMSKAKEFLASPQPSDLFN